MENSFFDVSNRLHICPEQSQLNFLGDSFIAIKFFFENLWIRETMARIAQLIFKKIIETSLPEYCCRELLEFCWCLKPKECLEFYSELPQVFLWAVTYLPKKLNKTIKSLIIGCFSDWESWSLYRLFFLRSIVQFFTQTYMNCFVSS